MFFCTLNNTRKREGSRGQGRKKARGARRLDGRFLLLCKPLFTSTGRHPMSDSNTHFDRRWFLKMGGLTAIAAGHHPCATKSYAQTANTASALFKPAARRALSRRRLPEPAPPVGERRFVSEAIEQVIAGPKRRSRTRSSRGCSRTVFPIARHHRSITQRTTDSPTPRHSRRHQRHVAARLLGASLALLPTSAATPRSAS